MRNVKSVELFNRAQKVIPGGVNSPVRACRSVGMSPVFVESAKGCMLYDEDGNEYIDYVGSWGAMIIGHKHESVVAAIKTALAKGSSYGAPTNLETELAELIVELVPSVEMVRMVNSGTEATMSAIRLARGYTGRDKIVKFDGCYHGHADSLLVEAGSGVATLGIPGSPGVPKSFVKHTISLPYNNVEIASNVIEKYAEDIACVIVEPVAGNMGLVSATADFLKELRFLTEKIGAVLIFDEVMSGFRLALGGAQELFGLEPDLSCYGKIIGGGLPVGAYGGSSKIMTKVAPQGEVYQAGTLSGNPLAMAAGIATLNELKRNDFYDLLDDKAEKLVSGLRFASSKFNVPTFLSRVGSMVGLHFTSQRVANFSDAKDSDLELFSKYYKSMLKSGIYLPPSQFETMFISSEHDLAAIDRTVEAAEIAFSKF